MTASDPSPSDDVQIERLLAAIVDLAEREQPAALETLCLEHSHLAVELRDRFARYQRLLQAMPPETPTAAGHFGEFALLRELGRGGMGVVYLARQQRAGRDRLVALKLVRDRGLFSPHARERLRREAAASFRLDDPGLCPVFDVGEVDGVPWLAMRYVPGRTLAEHIADARGRGVLDLPTGALQRATDTDSSTVTGTGGGQRYATVLALGESLAQSLHVAHEAGFVHRDVKPSNVMITPEGQPVLLDFGLVREQGQDHSLTATGETLGTPAYMAPEQIDGETGVDRTADVYSLAATLWEAIALERPFAGRTREELFAEILRHDLRDLRRVAASVSRDLQLVLATAMAREPDRRYATAMEFALELRRVRRSEPILTRPPGPFRRLALWSRRNRLAAGLLAGLFVSLVVVLLVATEARDAAQRAQLSEQRAVANLGSARRVVAELIRVQNDELADVPGLAGLRRDMQERALAFLAEVRAASAGHAGLAGDNAEALVLGATLELSLGRPAAAVKMHSEARQLLESLGGARARSLWGQWHLFDGEVRERRGDFVGALAAYEAAAAELELAHSDDDDTQRAMRALCQMSDMLERRNDRVAASAAVDRAVGLRERLTEPDNPRSVMRWSAAILQRARLHREADRNQAADVDYESAITALRVLLANDPQSRHAMVMLSDCLISHAALHRLLGRGQQRREALLEAQQLLERLVASFPRMPSYRHAMATVLSNRASLLQGDGHPDEAIVVLKRARQLLQDLVSEFADNRKYRSGLASVLFNLGNRVRRDTATSGEHYMAALAQLDHLLEIQPDDAKEHELAARVAMNLAIGRAIAGEPAAADTFVLAREHADHVLRLRPSDQRSRRLRGILLFNEGVFRAESGDLVTALPVLGQAFDQALDCVAATPNSTSRAAEMLKWGVRYAQVTDLVAAEQAAAAWQRVAVAWRALPAKLQRVLEGHRSACLDCIMLRRGCASPGALAGEAADREALVETVQRLATIETASKLSAAGHAERLLCLVDLAVGAEVAAEPLVAADHRAAAAQQLQAWPEGSHPDNITRRRLRAQRAQLEACTAAGSEARAALERLLGPR